ncbi:hypothetical protein L6164_013144 [Bauhinia variegata]|uniref:Uncharacterized protein n=1 Tax=Bauhinia variegata TaxID=167791 RepID=A0ACB9PB83_BAUVA|nr:hypothetical protein L6164_013144 [Bauhinia variegata]
MSLIVKLNSLAADIIQFLSPFGIACDSGTTISAIVPPYLENSVQPLLIGYDLQGYIDGSTPCPSKPLNNAPNVINPTYTNWVRQDQLILHAIVSSIKATVVTHLGVVRTSKQAWDTLKTMYVGRSRMRIMALKQRISTFTKGTQSMASYLQGIKVISDELSIIDSPLDNTDLVIHTLNGLGAEYREISAVLRARETPIDFAELYEKLMDFETLMHRDEPSGIDPILAMAHAASHRHHKISFDNNSSMVNQQPKKKVICQFCEKPRHTAKYAYLCLDPISNRVYSSRHVNFIENSFPYSSLTQPQSPSTSTPPLATNPHTLIPTTMTTTLPIDSPLTQPPLLDPPHTATTPDIVGVSDLDSSSSPEDSSGNNTSTPPLLHSVSPNPSRCHPMVTRSQNNIFKPKKILTASQHALLENLEPSSVYNVGSASGGPYVLEVSSVMLRAEFLSLLSKK